MHRQGNWEAEARARGGDREEEHDQPSEYTLAMDTFQLHVMTVGASVLRLSQGDS